MYWSVLTICDLYLTTIGSSKPWCLRMWCLIIVVTIRFDKTSLMNHTMIVRHNLLLSNTTSSNTTTLNSEYNLFSGDV